MTGNPHFEAVESRAAARSGLSFDPLAPKRLGKFRLQSLRIHVRDHRLREVPFGERTLEAHYGSFTLSQSRKGVAEARRLALDVSYGAAGRDGIIAGHTARIYELGPEPPPDDIDGRSPSVVTWHDGEMFYLIASGEMPSGDLVKIAASLYA